MSIDDIGAPNDPNKIEFDTRDIIRTDYNYSNLFPGLAAFLPPGDYMPNPRRENIRRERARREELRRINKSIRQEYSNRFDFRSASQLRALKVPFEVANQYAERFNCLEIVKLCKLGCTYKIANKYNERFNSEEVVAMFKAKVFSDAADKYDNQFYGWQIAILYRIGLKPDKITIEKQKALHELLNLMISYSDIMRHSQEFTLIGTGANGIVLLKNNLAWKFSQNIEREYLFLDKIREFHKNEQKNVIKVIGKPKGNIAIELEYIEGDSLENVVKEFNPLLYDDIIKYGYDVLNGLIELHDAGVYHHHDIRPANIMIDMINDRAVIIDLGTAVDDKNYVLAEETKRGQSLFSIISRFFSKTKDRMVNRRFGGPNDLTSLGQVMYFMATGMHIFDQSQSMSRTFGSVAEQIDDYRTKVYADETGKLLEMHLKQVEHDIKDERLAHLIKTCLTAKHYQYGKVRRMFERYVR